MPRSLQILFVALIFISGCTSGKKSKPALPDSTGKSGSVAVWIPGDLDVKEAIEKVVMDSLEQVNPLFFASEPMLEARFYNGNDIPSGGLYHKNVLAFKVLPDEPPGAKVVTDPIYAKGQYFILINAPDAEGLIDVFRANATGILQKFIQKEDQRLHAKIRNDLDKKISSELKSNLGFTMDFPRTNSSLNEITKEYAFLTRNRKAAALDGRTFFLYMGFLISQQPYTDTAQFNKKHLIARRDELLREIVEGPEFKNSPPTFPQTTPDSLFTITRKVINHDNAYGVELFGQWGVVDSLDRPYGMGGPFMSLTVLDEQHQRLITADAYVYAPNTYLREYMRELRTILYSLAIDQ